jgi:hypothetical protein
MVNFGVSAKLALISIVIFYIVGYDNTYRMTGKVFGKLLKQDDMRYGMGNTFSNRGFIVHAIVFGVLMFLVAKYGLKLE